jgi:cell division septation protein DedD
MRLFRQHRHERQGGFNHWRFLLFGAVVLLSAGVWIFLQTMDQSSHSESSPSSPAATAVPSPVIHNDSSDHDTPAFTFYETLQDPAHAKSEPLVLEPKPKPPAAPGLASGQTIRQADHAPRQRLRGYILQVAAFRERSTAMNLINRLEKKGYSAYLLVRHIENQGILYRVRLGPYGTRSQAEEMARRLKAEERLGSYIARAREDR